MRIKIYTPQRALLDTEASAVTAEAENGRFCLLPRHIDFVTALAPGLLEYRTKEGAERYAALDEGVLVKQDQEVMISVRNAVLGDQLGELKQIVEEQFHDLDDRERRSRSALAKMEADFTRRLMDVRQHE